MNDDTNQAPMPAPAPEPMPAAEPQPLEGTEAKPEGEAQA
jgi:hypothetical protein